MGAAKWAERSNGQMDLDKKVRKIQLDETWVFTHGKHCKN